MTIPKILCVDDDEPIRKLLAAFLQHQGYELRTAENGLEALRAIREDPPNLVITDINMPYVNGIELTKRLRNDPRTARVPVIMLSAMGESAQMLAGYEAGADEYVTKPVEMPLLAAKIATLLRRAAAAGSVPVGAGGADPSGPHEPVAAGRVVAFVRGKGGVGVTTLAVNTAVLLAGQQRRVILLDLNLEFGNVPLMMDVRPKRTLAQLADVPLAEVGDVVVSQFLTPHPSGVQIVAAPESPEQAELVSPDNVKAILQRLRTQADYILVDLPAAFSETTLAAIDLADAICLVTSAHTTALVATFACLRVLDYLHFPSEQRLVVLNRVSPGGTKDERVAERFLGRKLDREIPYTPQFGDAADAGKPVVSTHPKLPGVVALQAFAAQLTAAVPVDA